MCDQDHFEEDRLKGESSGLVTRRQFGALVAAGVALTLPKVVDAVAVTEMDVTIKTPDGTCDAYFVHPATGTAPGVLVWPDIFGLRPAFRQMGKRLAETGYSVVVINPFYRAQKAPTAAKGAATPIQDLLPLHHFVNRAYNKLIDQMIQRIPKIEQSGLHSIHVGRDGITPDQRAIYSASGIDGFYLACGLSGTGFKTSPAAGASMVELILDGAPKTVDITPFRFERFANGQLLEGEYGYGHIWK